MESWSLRICELSVMSSWLNTRSISGSDVGCLFGISPWVVGLVEVTSAGRISVCLVVRLRVLGS